MPAPESLAMQIRRLRGQARREAISEVVSRWRASGRSRAAFCREEGIAPVTLGRWIRTLEAKKAPRQEDPLLVEVGRGGTQGGAGFEVVLPNGISVTVPPGFRAGELSRLLATISPAC